MKSKHLIILTWSIALLPTFVGIILAFLVHILWLNLAIISGIMLKKGFTEIPLRPPNIGVITIWGKKTNIVLGEMLVLLADYFPFYLGVTLINIEKKNKDAEFPEIRCRLDEDSKEKEKLMLEQATEIVKKSKELNGEKITLEEALKIVWAKEANKPAKSGGAVRAYVSLTYVPDEDRPREYIDSGGKEGVEQIIHDMIAEDLRQAGEKRTWEQMTFAKDRLSATLIVKLTGRQMLNNKYIKEMDEYIEFDDKGKPKVKKGFEDKVNEEQFFIDLDNDLGNTDGISKDISNFLKQALINGAADVHDLGIKIRRLNVMRVEPQGELAKDAEYAARELQQRRRQDTEQETRNTGAKEMVNKAREAGDDKLTFTEALQILRIEEEKTKEVVVRSSGNQFLDAAALFQQNKQ